VTTTTVFCPAKLNLFLAITGRRADGFHDLVSVAVTLDFGDELTLTRQVADDGTFTLQCDDPDVPSGADNLVLKAARAFAAETGWAGGVDFQLVKRTPMGAGLGGGSSDGVGALLGLNALAGHPLDAAGLRRLAVGLGSDCPLFLGGGPLTMRGRGERLEPWGPASAGRVAGRRVLVFKPPFGVNTAWAYGRLAAAAPGSYLPDHDAEARLAAWLRAPDRDPEALCFNNMEPAVFEKFPALPVLAERLEAAFGLRTHMSGSGSACFAFLAKDAPVAGIETAIRRAWGPAAFVTVARIRGG
jgi:4-diphosphocytidyl-2-C-methyl-D-erythritol kinase